jgi:hypothetical protein
MINVFLYCQSFSTEDMFGWLLLFLIIPISVKKILFFLFCSRNAMRIYRTEGVKTTHTWRKLFAYKWTQSQCCQMVSFKTKNPKSGIC